MPESLHNEIARKFDGEQAKRKLFTRWLAGHPCPTWDHVEGLLRWLEREGRGRKGAAEEVKETYIKSKLPFYLILSGTCTVHTHTCTVRVTKKVNGSTVKGTCSYSTLLLLSKYRQATVEVRSYYRQRTVLVRSSYCRGTVLLPSTYGLSMVELLLKYGLSMVELVSRYGLSTFALPSRYGLKLRPAQCLRAPQVALFALLSI